MAEHASGGHGKGGEHGEGTEHKKHKKHVPHMHEEHEHEEGWIVSFADNVLLMMGFFVILLAMNMGPKGSSASGDSEGTGQPNAGVLDFAIAVREAFHNPVNLNSTATADQPLIRRLKERQSRGTERTRGPEGEDQKAQTVRHADWVGEDGYVTFADNEFQLSDTAKAAIRQFSENVAGTRWMVEIRGHASRWESWGDERKARFLSYERAWVVGNELIRHGVSWDQIRLVAGGDGEPFRTISRDKQDRAPNQRAELYVLNEQAPADIFTTRPKR
ncbi:MAG: OmpA family protein [Tepidisphaera sp.]|jgi:outer membrane protein OmpA-like peptidoglycan-associated protein